MIASSLQEFCQLLKPSSPIIGIDYGAKKLGSAISDPGKVMAVPLEVVSPKGEQAQIGYILGLVDKHKACGVVLGLPIRMDGSDSDQTKLLRIFADKLSSACPVPIFLQDERLSSAAAQSLLREAGMKRKQRDAIDDKIAASIILETVINGMLG